MVAISSVAVHPLSHVVRKQLVPMFAPIGNSVHEISPVWPALALLASVVDPVALASVLLLSCRERLVDVVIAELVPLLRMVTCPQ